MSHYDKEDDIPQTVETQLELYKASRAIVSNGAVLAERLLGEAAPALESLFDAAQKAGASDLMAAVNEAWTKTQELAKAVGHQDAALNGADAIIAVIKQSRKAVLKELDILKTGLQELDSEAHPLLEQFRNTIESEAVEAAYYDLYMFDDTFDIEAIVDRSFESLEPLLEEHITFINRRQVCQSLVDILLGGDAWTDEQGDILIKLLKSLEDAPHRAAIEEAEDYEAAEEAE